MFWSNFKTVFLRGICVDQAEEFKDWERRKEEEIYTFNVRGKSLISEEDRR